MGQYVGNCHWYVVRESNTNTTELFLFLRCLPELVEIIQDLQKTRCNLCSISHQTSAHRNDTGSRQHCCNLVCCIVSGTIFDTVLHHRCCFFVCAPNHHDQAIKHQPTAHRCPTLHSITFGLIIVFILTND